MDVAELGIRVGLKDGQVVVQQLETIGATGEASQRKVQAATSQSAVAMEKLRGSVQEAYTAWRQGEASLNDEAMLRRVGLIQQQTGAINQLAAAERAATEAQVAAMSATVTATASTVAATESVAVASASAGAGLGRLRQGFTSMAASLTGINPLLARIASTFGAMEIGLAPVLALLAGVVALTQVYKALHEASDKAKDTQNELTEALGKWYDKQKEGAAGELPKQIDALNAKMKELQATMTKLGSDDSLTRLGARLAVVGEGGSKWKAWVRILNADTPAEAMRQYASEVEKGTKVVTNAIKKGGDEKVAATQEVAKRLDDQANKEAMDRLHRIETENAAFAVVAYAAADVSMKQLDELRKTNFENNKALTISAQATELAKREGLERDILAEKYKAQNEVMDAANKMSGIALDETTKRIEQVRDETIARLKVADAIKQQNAAMAANVKLGKDNKATTDRQTTDAAKKIEQEKKYSDDVEKIWRNGIEKITTHGFKNFHNFFEDVLHLFSELMDKMTARAKELGKLGASGFQFDALKYGSAALAGGLTGYQIGQQSGNTTTGVLGGAAAGAATGAAFGPWGAAIGGLAGAAGGLLGAAKAQHEAAEAQKKAAEAAKLSLLQFNVTAGTGTALELNQAQLKAQAQALFDAIDAALPGLKNQIEREKEMAQVRKDETLIALQLIAADKAARETFVADLGVRNLVAAGMIQAADAARQAIASEKELADARKQFGEQSAEYQSLVATQAAEAAKRAADAADVLKRSFEDLAVRALAASGANDRAVQDMQFQLAQERELADLRKSGASDDIIARTQEILALEQKRRDDDFAALNQNARADYQVRGLRASGNAGAADDLAFALAQQRELETAIKQGLDAGTIAALKATQAAEATQFELAKQTKIMQDQLTAAQSQLQAAQQSLTAVKQLHDSLATFGLSLRTGALSPLSPADQLAAARSQLATIFNAARGGDQVAAGKFEGAANTFLQSSRGYNASGAGYTQDFGSVQSMTDALSGQFGAQASLQQQMVDALQKQIDLLTKELDATKTGNASLISAITASRDGALAPADALLTALDALKASSSADAQAIIAAQSSSLLENRNAVATAANGEIAAITAGKTATEIASLAQIAQLEQVRLAGNVNAIQQIQSLSQMTGVQLQQVQSVEAFRTQANQAGQAQIAAVKAGSDAQTIYQLGQIASIERQRTDYNAGVERQITLAGQAYGLNSQQVITLQQTRDATNAGFISQINAVGQTTAAVGRTTAAANATDDSVQFWIRDLEGITGTIGLNVSNHLANIEGSLNYGITFAELDRIRLNLVSQNQHGNIAAYALGGDFDGGLRLVGERGPELEVTGPSRIFNAAQTRDMLNGGGSERVVEVLTALVTAQQNTIAVLQAGFRGTVASTDAVAAKVDDNTTTTRRGFEAVGAMAS
jgi:hypothetical protein